MRALWASFLRNDASEGTGSFFAGMPIERVLDVVEPLREGRAVGWRSLGVELRAIPLSDGRELGLPEAWAQRLEERDPSERRVLLVGRIAAGSPASQVLREGDLVLRAGSEIATRVHEVTWPQLCRRWGWSPAAAAATTSGASIDTSIGASAWP